MMRKGFHLSGIWVGHQIFRLLVRPFTSRMTPVHLIKNVILRYKVGLSRSCLKTINYIQSSSSRLLSASKPFLR